MIVQLIGRLGQSLLDALHIAGEISGLLTQALKALRHFRIASHRRLFWLLFKRQMYNAGFRAAYINTAIAILLGWLVMSKAYALLPAGVKFIDYYSQFFVIVVVREIGPLISGVILISRSANAVTAEMAQLKVHGQFDALSSQYMSSPLLFLLPVFLAFPLSLLLMFFYFNMVCVVSAYLVISQFHGVALGFNQFLTAILANVSNVEIFISVCKAWLGGLLVGLICIYYGTQVEDRLTDVSRAISNSNTTQLFGFFVLNVLLSLLAYR